MAEIDLAGTLRRAVRLTRFANVPGNGDWNAPVHGTWNVLTTLASVGCFTHDLRGFGGSVCPTDVPLFVEESIYEDFITQLATMARGVKLGHGLDPETKMGPLVSRSQQQRVLDYVRIGVEEKAVALSGGRAPSDELANGCFVEPTVFACVNNQMRIAREEIFGPVVCAIPFRDLPDAIAKGNDSPYGLAAGVWTRDIRKAHQAASALDVGTVWVNCYNAFDNASPWGGFKQSGWGREKGPYGLDLFTQVKSVVINYS